MTRANMKMNAGLRLGQEVSQNVLNFPTYGRRNATQRTKAAPKKLSSKQTLEGEQEPTGPITVFTKLSDVSKGGFVIHSS